MIKKNIFILLIIVLSIMITACKKDNSISAISENTKTINTIEDENNETVPNHDNEAINPLTGLYINKDAASRRPIGIMINNLKAAMPQSGIGQADIIYETLVEGSICRLFALFQDFDTKKIGPIRSARHYFLDFTFDFDAIYVHYGESPQANIAFNKLNADHLNGLSGLDSIMCFQDPNRNRPHSTYTSYEGLMNALDYKGYRKEINSEINSKFKFHDDNYIPDSNLNAQKVELPFSTYSNPWFEYNGKDKLYYRFQFDDKHIDAETNEQLKFKNIIIQFVDMWVISGDKEGRLDLSLVSNGTGYYITNSKAIPITWEKTSHESPTHYYFEDNTELLINKGKTWIAVFPSYRKDKIIFN